MNKKDLIINIGIAVFTLLIVLYLAISPKKELKLLREQNQQMKTEMLEQHKKDKIVIDSLTTMNSYYENKIKTIDSSLEELKKKYEYEKKKHAQNINEVYTASDSATILWFNGTYPK